MSQQASVGIGIECSTVKVRCSLHIQAVIPKMEAEATLRVKLARE
jgi:hypothetical protein